MNFHDFTAKNLRGEDVPLSSFKGKVVLVVNVASECGFTPQYEGLEALQKKYGPRGFAVLGFPCNQFGKQEPGTEAAIESFCETKFRITFPMFSKIDVNGASTHPLYQYLKKEKPGLLGSERIKWNFTKFLVGKDGNVVKRFAPNKTPEAIAPEIEPLL